MKVTIELSPADKQELKQHPDSEDIYLTRVLRHVFERLEYVEDAIWGDDVKDTALGLEHSTSIKWELKNGSVVAQSELGDMNRLGTIEVWALGVLTSTITL